MAGLEELAIYGFPLAGFLVFATVRFIYAIPVTVLAGFLLLPPAYGFNPPFLPSITKGNVIALSVVALAALFAPRRNGHGRLLPEHAAILRDTLPGLLPRAPWAIACLGLLLLGPLGTTLTNLEPVSVNGVVRPGLGLRDAINTVQRMALVVLPLLVARKFLGGEDGQRAVLFTLAAAGLAYSLPTLVEVRLSPQLHNWVYGYFQHSWIQHIRGDGFRPTVFLRHGLVLGLFLCMSLLAVLGYMRAIDGDRSLLYLAAAVYLAVVLLLAKSLGALMIAAALSPVMLLLGIRVQLVVAAAIAAFVLLYPAMRSAGMSPFGPVVSAVASVSPGRAASFDFRLEQEEVLSVHAMQKPVFGWGGYSRALSVPEDVKHASVRDGAWLIRLGESGWAGYVGLFGLLGAPLLLLALRATRVRPSAATSALAVILAANLLDLIPNSGLTVVTMVIAGALIGRLEHASVRAPAAAQARVAAPRLCEPVARARPRLPDMATEGHGLQPDGAAPVVPGAVSARAPDAIEAARPRPGGRYSRFPVRPRPDRLV